MGAGQQASPRSLPAHRSFRHRCCDRLVPEHAWHHEGMARPILLDVDTGTDDALAILYAVRHPDLEVLGISCVAGNSSVDQVVTNTLKVLDAADAPLHPGGPGRRSAAGRARPPGGRLPRRGRPGRGRPAGPDPVAVGADRGGDAPPADHGGPEPVTLVGLAPQTNLAMLLTLYPEVTANLERIVFMGGSAGVGNVTAVAEFNVWQDPEAATCVIESPVPDRHVRARRLHPAGGRPSRPPIRFTASGHPRHSGGRRAALPPRSPLRPARAGLRRTDR